MAFTTPPPPPDGPFRYRQINSHIRLPVRRQRHSIVDYFDQLSINRKSFYILSWQLGSREVITIPRHRRLEAFMTDVKTIQLISRRVAVFPTMAVRQFFDADCQAADLKIFPGWHPQMSDPAGSSGNFPVDKILHTPFTVSSCLCHDLDLSVSHDVMVTWPIVRHMPRPTGVPLEPSLLSSTVFEIFASKYMGHDLDLSGSFDTPGVISYRCSIVTKSVFLAIFEIIGPKPCAHTQKHWHTNRHMPQVILYSVPCNVLQWTDKNF